MKLSGPEILVKSLAAEGVTTVFGHPGGILLLAPDTLSDYPFKPILCRHEQVATHAAEGYYKATGRVGTVMVTSGPGAANCVTAIIDALIDSMAIVVISGQGPTAVMSPDVLQEADVVGTTRACTKHNFLALKTEDIPRLIKEAYHIARSGRPGPVLIDLPQDVTMGRGEFKGYPKSVSIRGYNPQVSGHPGQIKRAVELISRAKRPVIYGGGGIIHSDASPEFQELVDITQIPTTLSLMGLGALPTDHPLWLGMLGMHGTSWANMCMTHCDVMIAIGCRFDERVTGKLADFGKQCKIIHIDIDPTSIQKNVRVDVPIVGDVKRVLRELNRELRNVGRNGAKEFEDWYERIEEWRKSNPLRYEQKEGIIKPQYAIDMIFRLTEDYEPIISTGVGQHQMWAAQVYRGRKPRCWLTSGGLGTMGYGFPSALGAQAAFPDSLVLNIEGDSSFQIGLPDLCTLVEYNLPVKTFVINNKGLGMARQWQQLFQSRRSSQAEVTHQPDFVKLAEAYGVAGMRIERPEEVKAGIEKAINSAGPVVVDVVVDREESCLPTVPAAETKNTLDPKEASRDRLSHTWS
ncbi:MAG: biosynthetic-type acetolactate synthase large subunit [Candidatus Methylomirabilales bacterium]